LWNLPENGRVVIDASNSDYIDNDVLEIIEDFKNTRAVEKKIKLNLFGLKNQYKLKDQIQFVNVSDKESQTKMTPDDVLKILQDGNKRFITGQSTEKYLNQQVTATAYGQDPFAIILSCIDSRTTAEHIFDLGLGDIFSVRIAGNILNEDILGSMEFAVEKAEVKLLLVVGHTKCGAVTSACNHFNKLANLNTLLAKLQPAIDSETSDGAGNSVSDPTFVDRVAVRNVLLTMERIRKESTLIAESEHSGKIKIAGGLYDVETGAVTFLS
jgi:carbonic anhydrase